MDKNKSTSLSEKINKLNSLDDSKLIDIAKNYKHYGYEEEIMVNAIKILKDRGVDKELFKFYGSERENKIKTVEFYYQSFFKTSKIAITFYVLSILIPILIAVILPNATILYINLSWILITVYLIFFIKAYLFEMKFYKMIGKEYGTAVIIPYIMIGIPLYLIMYFYYKKRMREEIKSMN